MRLEAQESWKDGSEYGTTGRKSKTCRRPGSRAFLSSGRKVTGRWGKSYKPCTLSHTPLSWSNVSMDKAATVYKVHYWILWNTHSSLLGTSPVLSNCWQRLGQTDPTKPNHMSFNSFEINWYFDETPRQARNSVKVNVILIIVIFKMKGSVMMR